MATNDCLEAARAVAGEDVSDAQLEEILKLMDIRAKRAKRADPSLDDRTAMRQAADELNAEKRLETLIAKRNRALNVAAKKSRENFYEEMFTAGASESQALRALNVGTEGPFQGAGRSVDAVQHGIESGTLTGPMLEELNQAGLLDVALMQNADYELSVAREMARLNGDKSVAPTKDANVKRMAEIFVKYVETSRLLQNDAGAFIRKMPGYITRQSHDQVKIYKAKEQWAKDIRPLLDERTFDGVDNIDQWLQETWVNLSSGDHDKAGGSSDWLGGFEGPGNLAKRASRERVLHFKDPDAWMEYNNKYGRESLWEAVLDGLRYGARNTALMRTWGTNPEAAFRADMRQLAQKAKKRGDVKEAIKVKDWLTNSEFQETAGSVAIAGNPTLASYAAAWRGVVNMAKLGKVVWAALSDMPIRAAVLRHNGKPLTETWGESFHTLLSLFHTPEEKKQVARMLNIGTQGLLGGVFNRLHATDSLPGTIGKMNNTFFRVTLLTAWTDGWARSTGLVLSNDMATHLSAGKTFTDLNSLHQTTLRRYGLGEREWEVFRKAELHLADGDSYLMPENIKALPDEVIRDYIASDRASARQIARVREDLATSLSTYYVDQVREALTFGGAKERAMLSWGAARGTPHGETIRMMMQFKQFPTTFVTKHLGREFRRGGKVDKMGLAHLLASTTAFGYLSLIASDFWDGKEPRDPAAVETWIAAMLKGGGLGIYGDFLFGTTNRMGGSVADTLAGPTFSDIDRYASVLTAMREGRDPSAQAIKAVSSTVPYNNLFGARLAVDHMFLRGLQETVNPGYLRRYQRQVEREQNTEFWLEPTSAWNQ